MLLSRARKFSGNSGDDWEKWVDRFEAQTHLYKDEDRLQCLLGLLEDDALDVFVSLSAKAKVDYSTVKAALTDHFGKKTDTLQAHAELGRAMQEPGESVESFASRVRKIGKLAYPGVAEGDKTVEGSITSRFICGLRDEWVQRKLCGRAPTTLKEAVKVFKELRSQQEAA